MPQPFLAMVIPVGGGGPVDPGYGRPAWTPVDPGYGRPSWGLADPDYGVGAGLRPSHGLPSSPGHPAHPLPPAGQPGSPTHPIAPVPPAEVDNTLPSPQVYIVVPGYGVVGPIHLPPRPEPK